MGIGWRQAFIGQYGVHLRCVAVRNGNKGEEKTSTYLRAIGCSLDDAIDKLGAVAFGEDAFRVKIQVPGYWNRHRIHIHFRRDAQSVRVLVVAAREVVAADGAKVRQDIFWLDIAVADASGGHGYLGRVIGYPLSDVAIFDCE